MILPVFKTGERRVRPVSGAFDSHTLPPISQTFSELIKNRKRVLTAWWINITG